MEDAAIQPSPNAPPPDNVLRCAQVVTLQDSKIKLHPEQTTKKPNTSLRSDRMRSTRTKINNIKTKTPSSLPRSPPPPAVSPLLSSGSKGCMGRRRSSAGFAELPCFWRRPRHFGRSKTWNPGAQKLELCLKSLWGDLVKHNKVQLRKADQTPYQGSFGGDHVARNGTLRGGGMVKATYNS